MSLKKTLLMALVFASLSACIKQPKDESSVPATPEEVADAVAEAWGTSDPSAMKVNDFVFQETEQKIENNPEPFFVLQEGITVSGRTEDPEKFIYTFLYQSKTYSQDQEGAASTREDQREIYKPEPSASLTPSFTALQDYNKELKPMAEDYHMRLGFELVLGLAGSCIKPEGLAKYCTDVLGVDSCDIQCSNLKVENLMAPVPDLIKAQPDCGGFANCMMRTTEVKFDWTLSLTTGASVEKQKVNYSLSLSPDMPFLARMTSYCARQLYPLQGQKILVTTCSKLKNFKPGGS